MIQFFSSTIGKKIVVALTGLILFGFVVGHMLGNLQIFLGPQVFNDYAAFIKSMPALLWGTRLTLLLAIFLHAFCTVTLVRKNRQSRPVAYEQKTNIQSTVASRTMIYGGLFLAIYIVYHLLHFTVGSVHPNFDHADVYGNVIKGLSSVPVAIFYILGMVALGFHLYHGVWSVFQTLGLNHEKYNCWRRCLATTAALTVSLGYISIPVSVLLGVIK